VPDLETHCGLCQKPAELRESHLLPKAAFRLAREAGAKNPNPIVVTPRGAGSTSKQVSQPFLCGDCEGRFSALGERYVLSECLRGPSEFAVRDRLQQLSPRSLDENVAAYEVTGSSIQAEQYVYFAASVFWRATARHWHHDGRLVERITLGKRYQGEFREFLLDEAPFPSNARRFVHVWRGSGPGAPSVLPCSERVKGVLRHKFCIPGVLFILFVGNDAAIRFDSWALNSSNGSFMWLCPFEHDSLFQGFGRLIRQAAFAKAARRRRAV
jgi:hypothetical protein